jgi:hypothetical protein
MKIRVLSEGGLGNQLFQAAYAHHLSTEFPYALVEFIDCNSTRDRKFELNHFFGPCKHVTQKRARRPFGKTGLEIRRGLSRRLGFVGASLLSINEVSEVGGLGNQNERIISEIDKMSIIRRQLGLNQINVRGYFQYWEHLFPVNECFLELFSHYLSSNATTSQKKQYSDVFLHVRRGDYLKNPSLGPLRSDYYVELLEKYAGLDSKVTIHSDEADLGIIPKRLVTLLSDSSFSSNPWDLFRDAINSKVLICSNSSLSWWAAFSKAQFGTLEDSKIIFPSEWFRNVPTHSLGIIPPNWEIAKAIWSD